MRKFCATCHQDLDEVEKLGVLVDTCWQCRGVWLDPGELEKIISSVRGTCLSPTQPEPANERRNMSGLQDFLLADLSENDRALFQRISALHCGLSILHLLCRNANVLRPSDAIAYRVNEPIEVVERDLDVLMGLGFVQHVDAPNVTLLGLTTDVERRRMLFRLYAWQEAWRQRLAEIERFVGRKSSHASRALEIG